MQKLILLLLFVPVPESINFTTKNLSGTWISSNNFIYEFKEDNTYTAINTYSKSFIYKGTFKFIGKNKLLLAETIHGHYAFYIWEIKSKENKIEITQTEEQRSEDKITYVNTCKLELSK